MPHLGYLALTGADPHKKIPIPIWMHRGCTPFISRQHFATIYWPTLKPIVEALWAQGNQVLFYAEGKWDAHLEAFAELPAGSIIYHLDRSDPPVAHRILGKKFCLSGGVPNALLAFGKPEEVKAHCRRLIETIGAEGGYIMDASAIIQNDASLENLKAMTDATLEYGVYRSPSSPSSPSEKVAPATGPGQSPEWITNVEVSSWRVHSVGEQVAGASAHSGRCRPGTPRLGRPRRLAYLYIWHVLLSF